MKNESLSKNLYMEVRNIILQTKGNVYKAINDSQLFSYWEIGRVIVLNEQNGRKRAEYGKYILKELDVKLTEEFGRSYDERELRRMRQFYMIFQIRGALRPELSWTHYRLIFRLESEKAREYYLKEAVEQGWSTRALERQINSFYYERLLASKDKEPVQSEAMENTGKMKEKPEDFIRDPVILEFLGLPGNAGYKEKDIEQALITHLQKFLLELGKGFAFVARQQHIKTETSDFFVDLVFYNFQLKCFVLIDLKAGKLTHQDVGQMDMYVKMYDDLKKNKDDNPTIGIILCSDKEETVVKYSVLSGSKKLFAARYKLYMPTEEELKRLIENDRFVVEETVMAYGGK